MKIRFPPSEGIYDTVPYNVTLQRAGVHCVWMNEMFGAIPGRSRELIF